MTELLMELVIDFVEVNIPVVGDDVKFELAAMMMETLDIIAQ